IEVVMRVQCCVTDDPQAVRDAFAQGFGAYIVAPGYDTFFSWQGFGDVVDGVRTARANKDRAASRAAVSDELLDSLVVAGSADVAGAVVGVGVGSDVFVVIVLMRGRGVSG